jgi:hypothetical protein
MGCSTCQPMPRFLKTSRGLSGAYSGRILAAVIRKRRFVVQLLSVAFLCAQFAMLAHATTHLKADPHAVPTGAQVCGECLSFAPLQNIIGGAPALVLGLQNISDRIYERVAVELVLPRAFSAFRSRAPPTFL